MMDHSVFLSPSNYASLVSCLTLFLWAPVIVNVNLQASFPTYIYLIDNESVKIYSPKKNQIGKNIKQGVNLIVEKVCVTYIW